MPDWVVRSAIRALLRQRLRRERANAASASDHEHRLATMRQGPVALTPAAANAQHYEVPAEFFAQVLGPHLKYSCCLWSGGAATLEDAERAMLRLTTERADIADGMRVLDLGCGWGSWALWAAEAYPNLHVTAVSNSAGQRSFIEQAARRRGLDNIAVLTADMNTFDPETTYDRIVSVEMFEHMRNYERLLSRIARWLRPSGKLFVHVFCHRQLSYFFEDGDDGDWMARHFFTGGMMPSADLLFQFEKEMEVEAHWEVDGREYQRTALAWLDNLDAHRAEVEAVLASTAGAGAGAARRDTERWRLFFLACAELFGYAAGQEWFVAHYLLHPPAGHAHARLAY